MANKKKIFDKDTVNQTVLLEGELKFSSITKKIKNGSELYPADVYRVQVSNPRLADINKWNLQNNGADTELAKRLFDPEYSHSVYTTKSGEKEWSYDSRNFPPRILDLKTKDFANADEVLEGELANGQTVVLAFRVYQSKNKPAFIGGSLDFVGIEDANNIKYFKNSNGFEAMFGEKTGDIKKKPVTETSQAEDTNTQQSAPVIEPTQPAQQNQTVDTSTDELDDLFD